MRAISIILLLMQFSQMPLAVGLDFETRAPRVSLDLEGRNVWQILHRKTGEVLFQGEDLAQTIQDNKSHFSSANMSLISIAGIRLPEADFHFSILHGTDLSHSVLTGCEFVGATLTGANLRGSDLSKADLSFAEFDGASLSEANLSRASIYDSSFKGCDLSGANLSKASIWRSDFEGADLSGTVFTDADFNVVWFEPAHLPEPESLRGVLGLRFLKVHNNFAPLVELRNRAYDHGLRRIGAELTCSIQRNRNDDPNRPWLYQFLSFYLFDATCAYGASPLRALCILAALSTFFLLIIQWNFISYRSNGRLRVVYGHPLGDGDSQSIDVVELLEQQENLRKYRNGLRFLPFSIFISLFLVLSALLGRRLTEKLAEFLCRHSFALRAYGGLRFWVSAYSACALFLTFLWAGSTFGRLFG